MMTLNLYKKGTVSAMDSDFESAAPFGKIKAGKDYIFCRGFIHWTYISFAELSRIYRRVEEVKGKTGCCSNDFSVHSLVCVTKNGESAELKIGEGLYRHEPERLMEYIKEIHPEIEFRKD